MVKAWRCEAVKCRCNPTVPESCACTPEDVGRLRRKWECKTCGAAMPWTKKESTVLDSILDAEPAPDKAKPIPVLPGQKRLWDDE